MASFSKNLQPLVDKYRINPETNKPFNEVLELFKEQPNYQVWGVKVVFSKEMAIDTVRKVADFVSRFSPLIKTLSKKNIVSYTTRADEKTLLKEMEGIQRISFLKEEYSKFNTAQKKMLFAEYKLDELEPMAAANSSMLREANELFKKFETLPASRKMNFLSNASAYSQVSTIFQELINALAAKYEWTKEDCIAFLHNNCPGCEITYDEGPILIVKVPNYTEAKKLCGGGRTQWCLANNDGERYFNKYVLNYDGRRSQYFFFDFSKKEYDELAHIGITIEDGKGIVEAYSCTDKNIHGGTIDYHGKKVNVLMALDMANVEFGIFMKMKNMKYVWEHDAIIECIKKNNSDLAISLDRDNIMVVNCLTNKGASILAGHTFINLGNIPVTEESKVYAIINLNVKNISRNSLYMSSFVKDSYGSYSESRSYNIFGVDSKLADFCKELNVKVEEFLGKEKIPNEILLHKYIDNLLETEACNLIDECREKGCDVDINYTFANRLPVFQAIGNKMYKLFHKIVEDKNFDCNKQDGFGETLLEAFLFQYCLCEEGTIAPDEKELLESCIKSLLSAENFDFNAHDINLDTPLNISCEYKTMNWITEALLSKTQVDVNMPNYFSLTPVSTAAMYKNTEALKMLAERPDVKITQNDLDVAKESGIDLMSYFKKESLAVATSSAK